MPRGRFLGKDIATSQRLADLSNDSHRMLWCMLVPHTDREGCIDGRPAVLKATAIPMLSWSDKRLTAALEDLAGVGLISHMLTECEQPVIQLTNFNRHQQGMKYDRETASKFGPLRSRSGVGPDVRRIRSEQVEGKVEGKVEVKVEVKEPPLVPPRGGSTRRKSKLSDAWEPTPKHAAFALKHGIDLELAIVAFRGHYDGQVQLSWHGRFTTWLANEVKFAAQRARPRGETAHSEAIAAERAHHRVAHAERHRRDEQARWERDREEALPVAGAQRALGGVLDAVMGSARKDPAREAQESPGSEQSI